uniref:Uncharacterized protein n=1 Tax=Panagrolaimus sp. ES5 TaxID=591445 RepID=A0AC34FNK5_9BILA
MSNKNCNVPFDLMVYEKKFQSYVEIFERFPDDFIISGDRLKVAFKKNPSMPKPVLPCSDDIGQWSNSALNKKDLRPQVPMPSFIPNVGSISNAAHNKKALPPPLPVLSFTHNVGFYSNIKMRAWSSTIYVRKLLTNEVIDEPLKTTKFSETPIQQQILLNLKKMNIYRLTCIQRYILPYLFSSKTDILIEGTKFTGRTTGVIASLLSQIYIYKNSVRTHKRGPIAVILLQSSPYQCNKTDTVASAEYANHILKILRLISEHMDIKIGFDSIDTSKDISVVTFKDIHEYEKKILSDLKYFVAFNVEKIIAKVGHEVFVARIEPFVPNYAVSVFVMEEYHDPGPILLQECFKPDTVFISDKS